MQTYFAAIKRGDAAYIAWFPDLDLAVTGERYFVYYDAREAPRLSTGSRRAAAAALRRAHAVGA